MCGKLSGCVFLPGQVKRVGTAPERHLARLQAELRATDKRHQDAMITKETTEFIVKRVTKVTTTAPFHVFVFAFLADSTSVRAVITSKLTNRTDTFPSF